MTSTGPTTWSPTSPNYKVYVSRTTQGPYDFILATGGRGSSSSHIGLPRHRRYFYVVTAVDQAGNESGHSNEASAIVGGPLPPLPYGQATRGDIACPAGSPVGSTCIRLAVRCPLVPDITATLRVRRPASTTQNRGTVVLTTGAAGTLLVGDSAPASSMVGTFVAEALTTVEVAWEQPGIWGGPRARTLACRFATVAKWTYDMVHVGGRTTLFAAQGTSGGAAQIAFALGFYGLRDLLDLANLGGGPPNCPLCSADGQHPFEPLLSSSPGSETALMVTYPSTVVRFFLGDKDPNDTGTADNARAYHDAITSSKSFTIVRDTPHVVESTQNGVDAFVAAVRAALK